MSLSPTVSTDMFTKQLCKVNNKMIIQYYAAEVIAFTLTKHTYRSECIAYTSGKTYMNTV